MKKICEFIFKINLKSKYFVYINGDRNTVHSTYFVNSVTDKGYRLSYFTYKDEIAAHIIPTYNMYDFMKDLDLK